MQASHCADTINILYVRVCVCVFVSVYYALSPGRALPASRVVSLKSLGGGLNVEHPGGFNRSKLRRRSDRRVKGTKRKKKSTAGC